jgi:hypothetical protein
MACEHNILICVIRLGVAVPHAAARDMIERRAVVESIASWPSPGTKALIMPCSVRLSCCVLVMLRSGRSF